ncbi:uncharacterized protein LOC123210692 [Mangifera indica]|uniref:uncharacterized protein LOC123210692 n=1 Tax=Mangifera indica TaxID=29780 RepID=UPI001CF9EF2E|nr:uncharacterized protein LOC123210692 [Mangifera indica]
MTGIWVAVYDLASCDGALRKEDNFVRGRRRREEGAEEQQQEEEFVKESMDFVEGGGGLEVKIVRTKEELQWLMIHLKSNVGKRLEDVLAEIGRGRGKVEAWKPYLESIMEGPETLEIDR